MCWLRVNNGAKVYTALWKAESEHNAASQHPPKNWSLLQLQALTPRRYRLPGYQVPPHLSPDAQAPQPHCQQPDSPVWGHGTRPGYKLQASCPAGGKERVRITARANRQEGGPHRPKPESTDRTLDLIRPLQEPRDSPLAPVLRAET